MPSDPSPLGPGGDSDRARSTIQLIFDRQFGSLFWGKLLSAVGGWTHNVVAAVMVYTLTGSALATGLVTVGQTSPQLLLTLISGRLADQGDPAVQALLGRCVSAGGSALLAVWVAVHPESTSAVPFVVASLIVGLGFVLGGPALQSVVPTLVTEAEMPRAMALNGFPLTLARALGPVLGAALATTAEPSIAFGFAALTHVLFAALLLIARIPPPPGRNRSDDFRIRTALRYVRQDRLLLSLLVSISVVGLISEPSVSLAPAIAASTGGTVSGAGTLASAFGIGGVVGFAIQAALADRLNIRWSPSCGLGLMSLGLALCAAPITLPMAAAAMAVCGLGFSTAVTGVTTAIQQRTPAALRGRVMALWLMGFLGMRPLSAGLLGSITDWTDVRVACGFAAVVGCATAVLAIPRSGRGRHRRGDARPSRQLSRSD